MLHRIAHKLGDFVGAGRLCIIKNACWQVNIWNSFIKPTRERLDYWITSQAWGRSSGQQQKNNTHTKSTNQQNNEKKTIS